MTRPKVCILTDWFLPGYRAGGPIKSVANLVRALHEHVEFSIITLNEDFGAKQPYRDIWANTWQEWENMAHIYYCSRDALSMKRLQYLVKQVDPDFLHLNSMFSIPFTVWPLKMQRQGTLDLQIILSPRGMLHPGALGLKSLKKKAYLTAAKLSGITKRITFHATDNQEVEDIRHVFGDNARILLAPNLPETELAEWEETEKLPGQLKLIFLSRISKKKNLHYLLDRLKGFEEFILLDLYGPVEDEKYKAELALQIKTLPENITVNFKGAVPQNEVPEILKAYHGFAMPTLGENFGHAIFEALAAGKPLLISDQTPWRNLEAQKAGWDLPLDQPLAFEQAIRSFIDLDQKTYNTWSRSAQRLAREFLASEDLLPRQLALYGLEA